MKTFEKTFKYSRDNRGFVSKNNSKSRLGKSLLLLFYRESLNVESRASLDVDVESSYLNFAR